MGDYLSYLALSLGTAQIANMVEDVFGGHNFDKSALRIARSVNLTS